MSSSSLSVLSSASEPLLSTVGPLVSVVELVVVVFAVVTFVGDAGVLLAGLALLYWIGPRYIDDIRPVAVVCVGFAVIGLAVVVTLKTATAFPRPAATPVDPTGLPTVIESVVARELDAGGFAFPSGHTVAATVVYGGLAVLVSVGRQRLRYLAAGSILGLVGLSRLVLGVHYPRDVAAGVVVGGAILAVGLAVSRDTDCLRPDRLFGLAAVVACLGFAVATEGGHTREQLQAVIAAGTALAGAGVWYRWGQRLTAAPAVSLPVAAVGLAVAGGLWITAYAGVLSTGGTILASGLAVSCLLLLPLLAEYQ